ncbi:MAG: hypothetical protein EXS08_01315 [Planctomycetes bacterium]|nr:hypothetical protein [Planctomycetota bacterium]
MSLPPLELDPALRPLPHPLRPASQRALLSVDGGGQHLLCAAERLTIGHRRAARADLGFLADVGALHAELVREESLARGPGWRLVPCGSEPSTIGGRAVPSAGQRIESGALVRLGRNLEFRLLQPDPASASVVLELLHGAECDGARHIVLLAPLAGGRVRVGGAPVHHVRVPGLDFALELEWHGAELRVRCDLPLAGPGPSASGSEGACAFPFPPRERVELTCGKPRGSRPPFALSFEPVLLPMASPERPPSS